MPFGFQRRIDSPSRALASVSCVFGVVCIDYIFLFRSVGFGPSSTLFASPSLSKHLGGKGLVVAAHRVVMDTLRVQLGVTRGPTFVISGTIPQAYLLLLSFIIILE